MLERLQEFHFFVRRGLRRARLALRMSLLEDLLLACGRKRGGCRCLSLRGEGGLLQTPEKILFVLGREWFCRSLLLRLLCGGGREEPRPILERKSAGKDDSDRAHDNDSRSFPGFHVVSIPRLLARFAVLHSGLHHLHINIDSGRKINVCQSFNNFRCGIQNIDHALVDAHLELFAGIFVDKGSAVDRVFSDVDRERHGSDDFRAVAGGDVDDLLHGAVEDGVLIGAHADAQAMHGFCLFSARDSGGRAGC
jgi:hypothetical protein